jgi:hypothetical protein
VRTASAADAAKRSTVGAIRCGDERLKAFDVGPMVTKFESECGRAELDIAFLLSHSRVSATDSGFESEFRTGGQREGETVEVGSLAVMFVEEGEIQCALTPEDSTELWRADIGQSETDFSIVELNPFADSPTVLIRNRRQSLNSRR